MYLWSGYLQLAFLADNKLYFDKFRLNFKYGNSEKVQTSNFDES